MRIKKYQLPRPYSQISLFSCKTERSKPDLIRSLLDLPEEILQFIVDFLDIDSVVALSEVNSRLLRISRTSLASVKIERRISTTVFRFLEVYGALVRRLDVSNYDNNRYYGSAESAILKCGNITDLNLINTDIEDWSALKQLGNLQTLRINMGPFTASQ